MKQKKLRIILLILRLVLVFIIFDLWYSYNYLTVTHYDFPTSKLESPVRAVILSDMHDHEFGKDNKRLIKAVAEEEPDVILLVGDMLNRNSENASKPVALVEALVQIAPVYYAIGNHENDYAIAQDDDSREALTAQLEAAGAVVLDRAYEDVEIGGQTLRIGGMYDYAFALDRWNSTNPENMNPAVYQFLVEFQDTDNLTIMMAHRPDSFIFGEASVTWQIDMVVSGHLHGGQVVLPFVGGVWGGDQRYFPQYVHGLYQKDNLHILITSGLGSNVQKVPRFNNPPEIMVVDFIPQK